MSIDATFVVAYDMITLCSSWHMAILVKGPLVTSLTKIQDLWSLDQLKVPKTSNIY